MKLTNKIYNRYNRNLKSAKDGIKIKPEELEVSDYDKTSDYLSLEKINLVIDGSD